MEQYKENFTEESTELIAELEKCLLQLEATPEDASLIQQVFRAMHTIKGNSSMFGYSAIAEFTHHLESIYEYVRSGQKKITKEILNVTLSSLDHLSFLVENIEADLSKNKAHLALSHKVSNLVHNIENELNITNQINPAIHSAISSDSAIKTYKIHFAPEREIFYNGSNPLFFLRELNALGECFIKPVLHIPSLEEIEPTHCYTSWDITLKSESSIQEIKNIFLFVEGKCELEITEETFSQKDVVQQPMIESIGNENKHLKEVSDFSKKTVISSIRVPSERLDTLMSLVSELITLQAKLGTLTDQNPQSELLAVSENLEKISTRLRDNAFSMCLVPIRNMITPFNRLVRDLAGELNKEIEFITEGTETELDKNIMESLSDPLMHLLRNSIDHGIEDQETRQQLGKSKHGKIVFKAYCAGTNVYIEIQDDGKGLDPEKIRNKAIQKGLITKDEPLSEKEIFNLIFLPGFSTAEQVSKISGRGVGMDVVKRKIEDIRGSIKIHSEVNIGTTIIIKLPITVSIIDGLLVKINNGSFVIPLASVERCFEAPAVRGLNRFNHMVILDGQQIPFISLSEEFDEVETYSGSQEIVLVYFEEKRVALIVDRILGKFQAVLKPLGRYFQNMENISGATILGDGSIALVLDTNKVAEQYLQKKRLAVC